MYLLERRFPATALNVPLPAFPPRPRLPQPITSQLDEIELGLRGAEITDVPFLRRLYAASRATELAGFPWPEEAKQVFFDSQFDMQHRHYVTHYATANFLIVLRRHEPIGRLYLHETTEELCIVDILLEQTVRGRGIGSALLLWIKSGAQARKLATIGLHVELRNLAARRLYERHGFTPGDVDGAHLRMTCRL